MKSKQLKKLAKLLFVEITQHQQEIKPVRKKRYNDALDEERTEVDTSQFNDYDEEVSTKTKKLILGLFQYRDRLNISISDNCINLSVYDLNNIKPKLVKNKLATHENYLQIEVYKGKGFTIGYNDVGNSKYCDDKIFDELIVDIKRINQEINRNNFDSIYHIIMKESGVIREANLDEVFNQINP